MNTTIDERRARLLADGWTQMGDLFYKDELVITNYDDMEAKIKAWEKRNEL